MVHMTRASLARSGRTALIMRQKTVCNKEIASRSPVAEFSAHDTDPKLIRSGPAQGEHLVLLVALLLQARLGELSLPQLYAPLLLQTPAAIRSALHHVAV